MKWTREVGLQPARIISEGGRFTITERVKRYNLRRVHVHRSWELYDRRLGVICGNFALQRDAKTRAETILLGEEEHGT